MMNLATLAYVPPPNFGCAKAFLINILKYKTRSKLILYSDHPYTEDAFLKNPNGKPVTVNPDFTPHAARFNELGQKRPAAISNMVFHTGIRLADMLKITHFIYLESDCRIKGDYWDEQIWEEYFTLPFPPVIAGTMTCFNTVNGGLDYYRRWQKKMLEIFPRSKFPVTIYGAPPIKIDERKPSVFVNGACGVYITDWLKQFFDLKNLIETAQGKAWDYLIGEKLYNLFRADALDLVAHLETVYSGFDNDLTTEETRLDWLREGKAVAIHQVKSNIVE